MPTIPIKPTTENIRSDKRPTVSVRRKIPNVLTQIAAKYRPVPVRVNEGDNNAIAGSGTARPCSRAQPTTEHPFSPET